MKRHKYKFRKELLAHKAADHRRHFVLKFLKSQNVSSAVATLSFRLVNVNFCPRSRIILYCLVTGRIRSTLSITNTSRHIFFWSIDNAFNTGFAMASW